MMVTTSLRTRYLGPEERRGSRIEVLSMEGRRLGLTSYDHGAQDPHAAAVRAVYGSDNSYIELVDQNGEGTQREYLVVTRGY